MAVYLECASVSGMSNLSKISRFAFAAIVYAALGSGCSSPPIPFSFRNVKIGVPYKEAIARHLVEKCRPDGKDRVECDLVGGPFAGLGVAPIEVSFFEGRLSSLRAMIGREDLTKAAQALGAAYGRECDSQTGVVDTSYGPVKINAQVFWCFAEGRLALEEYAYGLENSESQVRFPYTEVPSPDVSKPGDL